MNLRTFSLGLVLLMLTTLLLIGCTQVSTPPKTLSPVSSLSSNPASVFPSVPISPTITVEAQGVILKTISAMSQVSSFSLDTDIIDRYDYKTATDSGTSIIRWKGTRLISVPDKQMQMSMTIDVADSLNNLDRFTINMYFFKGDVYEQAWIPGVGNTGGIWNKNKLPDEMWIAESQISPVVGLLQNARQAILLGSETLNNVDCYVLNITTSPEAIADWVISQEQAPGPSLTLSSGPSLVGKDMFTKTFKGGIFQFWIDSASYLILKAGFTPYFEATPTDLGTNLEMTLGFNAQMAFSNYNQPVSIQVPDAALNIQKR